MFAVTGEICYWLQLTFFDSGENSEKTVEILLNAVFSLTSSSFVDWI